jgi:hypothetical protein
MRSAEQVAARKRWAYGLLRKCTLPEPKYGSAEWLALPLRAPARIAAVISDLHVLGVTHLVESHHRPSKRSAQERRHSGFSGVVRTDEADIVSLIVSHGYLREPQHKTSPNRPGTYAARRDVFGANQGLRRRRTRPITWPIALPELRLFERKSAAQNGIHSQDAGRAAAGPAKQEEPAELG